MVAWPGVQEESAPREISIQGERNSLKKTFKTAPVLNGEHPQVVMEAMRHSDLKLTMKLCTDAAQLQVGAALARLPWNGERRPLTDVG